jgi:hypothetical protein
MTTPLALIAIEPPLTARGRGNGMKPIAATQPAQGQATRRIDVARRG